MAYDVKSVTRAGKTAVITYTIPVLEKLMGSATVAMQWTREGWKKVMDPSSAAMFSHGSTKADIEAAKEDGYCSKS